MFFFLLIHPHLRFATSTRNIEGREREETLGERKYPSISSHFGIEFQDQPTEVSICFHNLKDQIFFSCYAPICSSPCLIPIFVPLHLYGFVSCLGSGGMCERGRDWWVLNVGFFLIGFFFFFFCAFLSWGFSSKIQIFFFFFIPKFSWTPNGLFCVRPVV